MTACVNKHSKRVAAVISASLVGALSLGVAVPAFAAEGNISLQSEETTPVWDGVDFTWNVEASPVNGYVVELGDQFLLTGATDPFGTVIPMSDLTVLYFKDDPASGHGTQGEFGPWDTISNSAPDEAGTYFAVVVNGRVSTDGISGYTPFMNNIGDKYEYEVVKFTVEAKSLAGSFAYQGDDVNDTTFQYTGYSFNDAAGDATANINFADADGNKMVQGTDYSIAHIYRVENGYTNTATDYKGDNQLVDAGTYIATLEGIGNYDGSTADVKFAIRQIDLANDTFTVNTVAKGTKNAAGYINGAYNQSAGHPSSVGVFVNGDKLKDETVAVSVVGGSKFDGTSMVPLYDPANYGGDVEASLTLRVGAYGNTANFSDPSAYGMTTGLVVGELVGNFYYDNDPIGTDALGKYVLTVDAAKGESFNPQLVTAALQNGTKSLPANVTVYRDGKVTEDYSTPGTLTVSVDVITPNNLSYGGSATITVTVKGKHYGAEPKVFATVDGKNADQAKVEYDGEAVEPVVVAKSGSVTIDSADYTVTYTDKDGNAVEEIVEPGEYTATVDFGNASWGINGVSKPVDKVYFTFTVTKATINSAKADKDVYPLTGEAVTPIFTAYTGDDLTGLSVEIDPAKTGVTYYEAKFVEGKPWTDEDDKWIPDESKGAIKASDLKNAGKYIAVVTVPADDPHFQGSISSQVFEISSYAVYSDVDASAWYADSVYNAAQLGYMTGIKGTDLFMPLADISRAELSQVFFNMAGNSSDTEKYYPTAFGDVDGWAWYAQPVAWASEAGIVTGYDADTFGPMDKATREQVAVMLYRYAKAQGKDVSVSDADATLAAYKDAGQVSDWAKDAMAWAVENGIFGVDTDELWAQENIQRAAVATIAVRFQPEALPQA